MASAAISVVVRVRRGIEAVYAALMHTVPGRIVAVALFLVVAMGVMTPEAFACSRCSCVPPAHGSSQTPPGDYSTRYPGNYSSMRSAIIAEHNMTADHILAEFDDQEAFMLEEVWMQHLLPAWMMMTEQITAVGLMQLFTIGTMFDAKQHLEVQTLYQKLTAQAHQDYQPDHQMCVVGTNVRSLAAAERNAEYTTFVMSQRSIDRQMGNMRQSSARENADNICFRMRQFREYYCDMESNNRGMQLICNPTTTEYERCRPANINITNASRNRDISFAQVVDRSATMELDFYDGATTPSDDERDVFALANNLYSTNIMFRMPEVTMAYRANQAALIDMRSVVAKRSVAENSFNTIIGMKAQGTAESETHTHPYMSLIWRALGVTDPDEIDRYLGTRPSYDAQMQVLTKRLYQQPAFFTNLYDEPANVERKGVALQAIALMQDFDTWNSHLRTEAMLSILLELELMTLQDQIEDIKGKLRAVGLKL